MMKPITPTDAFLAAWFHQWGDHWTDGFHFAVLADQWRATDPDADRTGILLDAFTAVDPGIFRGRGVGARVRRVHRLLPDRDVMSSDGRYALVCEGDGYWHVEWRGDGPRPPNLVDLREAPR